MLGFQRNVSYFLPFCVVHTFCLNGPAEQTKLLIFILFYFLHNSHLLSKNSVFSSLPFWQPVPLNNKKKHFLNTHPSCRRWFVWINRLLTLSSDTELYTHDVILTAEVCTWMGFYPKQSKWDHLLPRNTQSLEMSLCLLLCLQKSQQCVNPFIRNPSECRPLAADFQTTRKNADKNVVSVLFLLLHVTVLSSLVARRRSYITWGRRIDFKDESSNISIKIHWAVWGFNWALRKRSSPGSKTLWWKLWASCTGCTCRPDRSWRHRGFSRLHRPDSWVDLQSHPENGKRVVAHTVQCDESCSPFSLCRLFPTSVALFWRWVLFARPCASLPGSQKWLHPPQRRSCSPERCCPTSHAESRPSAPPQGWPPPAWCQARWRLMHLQRSEPRTEPSKSELKQVLVTNVCRSCRELLQSMTPQPVR